MEKETKPGVFISPITRAKWIRRIEALKGEDLREFVCKCNPASFATDNMEFIIGLKRQPLFDLCKELDPDFNPQTDFFVIRYAPEIVTEKLN